MTDQWRTDWAQFVTLIAKLHTSGMSDDDVAAELGGQVVHWSGKIARLRLGLDDEYARGPQINMKEERVPLRAGKTLVGGFVAVWTEPADEEAWLRLGRGDEVSFSGALVESIGLFPGIRVTYDDIDDDVILMVALQQGRVTAA